MEEYLLDEDLDYRQAKLLEEADSFDLEDFYHREGASDGAVCLITKNQMLMTDCYIKISPNNNYGMHFDTATEMYKAIYDKELDMATWENEIRNDGNILIRLCSKAPTLLFLPNTIDSQQLEMFNNFVKRMEFIINHDTSYFRENPIEILYWNTNEIEPEVAINDFETILEEAMKKEVKNGKKIH